MPLFVVKDVMAVKKMAEVLKMLSQIFPTELGSEHKAATHFHVGLDNCLVNLGKDWEAFVV